MLRRLPQAVPEIPVGRIERAARYYVEVLGFRQDWGGDEGGIAGISQGDCRLFLTNAEFRNGPGQPVVIWLNLDSKGEVDQLYDRWRGAGANVVAELEDKPWRLREFTVADPDGNRLRVFYDFSRHADDRPALACDLSAIADRTRYNALVHSVRAAIRSRAEIADGYVLELDGNRMTLPEAAEWIDMERRCCPFLTIEISTTGARSHWRLSLTGPEGVKAILDAAFPATG